MAKSSPTADCVVINEKSVLQSTTEIRKSHLFNVQKLEEYVARHVKGFSPPLSVRQFSHGQSNPTFLLKDSKKLYVMRKKPPGKLLKSAHAVDREYKVISALKSVGFPVPTPICFCEDESVIGTQFYIMEFVEGRIFRDDQLLKMSKKDKEPLTDAALRTLARLHTIRFKEVGLGDYGPTSQFYTRQINRWIGQYVASKTKEISEMDQIMEWLPRNIPQQEEVSIVHGDYRLENMIFHPTKPEVIAVLDWELSTLGHPLSDLAYFCVYDVLEFSGGLFSFNQDPLSQRLVEKYCQYANRKVVDNWHFYIIFSLFRFIGIAQGVYKRSLQGNASSETAGSYGVVADCLSPLAVALIEGATSSPSPSPSPSPSSAQSKL